MNVIIQKLNGMWHLIVAALTPLLTLTRARRR
jgi:hypothetical protein